MKTKHPISKCVICWRLDADSAMPYHTYEWDNQTWRRRVHLRCIQDSPSDMTKWQLEKPITGTVAAVGEESNGR